MKNANDKGTRYVRAATTYIDNDGVIINFEELEKYLYKTIATNKKSQRHGYKTIIYTTKIIEITGKKPQQLELF